MFASLTVLGLMGIAMYLGVVVVERLMINRFPHLQTHPHL
jgi:hypothetical protein